MVESSTELSSINYYSIFRNDYFFWLQSPISQAIQTYIHNEQLYLHPALAAAVCHK